MKRSGDRKGEFTAETQRRGENQAHRNALGSIQPARRFAINPAIDQRLFSVSPW